jgi:hypothetical protein
MRRYTLVLVRVMAVAGLALMVLRTPILSQCLRPLTIDECGNIPTCVCGEYPSGAEYCEPAQECGGNCQWEYLCP